jgi:hypothetical protein
MNVQLSVISNCDLKTEQHRVSQSSPNIKNNTLIVLCRVTFTTPGTHAMFRVVCTVE